MIITLNPVEQRLAKHIAECRYRANRRAGVEDAKIGPQSCLETDLEGAATEIAFCKITNTFPDLEIGSYADADAYTPQMGAVDVKSTTYRNGKLLARLTKRGHPPDAYALLVGKFPEYRFAGWLPADEVLNEGRVTDLGHGPTYAVPQEELRGLK